MEKYNYFEAICEDVENAIANDYSTEFEEMDREEFEEFLNDSLFASDSVTGNGSGSYTFNTWRAEENICHNFDLLAEALQEFGSDSNILEMGPEACDVTIRCYLLGSAIAAVLDEMGK